MKFPLQAKLKDDTTIEMRLASEQDVSAVQELFSKIVLEGDSYPHREPLENAEVQEYCFRGKSTIVAYPFLQSENLPLLGAFYLKPNWPGRARRVAKAGFMVDPDWRNKGLGWLLGATMLDYAKRLGYHNVIFNLVFSHNQVARSLWAKLGFSEIAVLPHAIANDDGSCQDGIIMFRSLVDDLQPHPRKDLG